MMGSGTPRGYQFVAHPLGKGEVGQSVPMQVADFAVIDSELDPAKPVGVSLHPGPTHHGLRDGPTRITHAISLGAPGD